MPRRKRLVFDGSYCHVLSRGNDRKEIFSKPGDYQVFLLIVKNYLGKFEVRPTNYCLMPNHLHFLFFVKKANDLSKFMQAVLQVYANYHRKEYNSVGFLYQNRFKSLLIQDQAYLLECARYMDRNPLRAGLVTEVASWPWSSFSYYANGIKDGIINTENPAFLALAPSVEKRRQLYFEHVLQSRPYDEILDREFHLK
jgi:putative transposase